MWRTAFDANRSKRPFENFAVTKLAKLAVALKIAGQFTERREKPNVASLGRRRYARPLEHFDQLAATK